jgi:sterol desaturase/sphingolipid hydroxylase (fatty acid hydroxylase superfamily)
MEWLGHSLFAGKSLFVGIWFAALFAGERFYPADEKSHAIGSRGARLGRNLAFWAINIGVSLVIVLPVTAWASGHGLWRPFWWKGWAGLALDILALDFFLYWWHRANHEIPFLWRFHSVHHLDQTLDTTTAVRFHFGEVLISAFARALVILVIGFPLPSVLFYEALILIAALFHHSNLKLPPEFERNLSRVIITPSIHWVHHHARKIDTDSNYGTVFSFWDRMFRSKSPTVRMAGMPIGVEGRAEEDLGALLMHPFRG